MTAAKSERLLNLVILLLVARNYTTKEQIRDLMEPYRESSPEAFDRMFERDKDDLRALGIPLETGFVDRFFEDEQGYRIKRDAFELPAIDFTADEVAVLGLAARVWGHAGLAAATSDALAKLRAAGLSFDREQLDNVQPTLLAEEPAFEAMWQATIAHTPVSFDYARPDQADAQTRHLEPWGVVTSRGRWYVVGLDTDREQPRLFRLSRIRSDVRVTGQPGSFTVPEGTDVRALSQSLAPSAPDRTALVLARAGAAHGLRRRAEVVEAGVAGPDGATTWDRLSIGFDSGTDFTGELLGYADAVVVESPPELRENVVRRLRGGVAAEAQGEGGPR